jgi:energy-coupling factor transporter ATP-binding protein EcfA2
MAIELAAARYRYAGSGSAALGPIDLRVEPGRVVGVAGANESGKSTLCVVAAGVAPAVIGGRLDGAVRIDGVDAATLRPHELAQRCGLVFEEVAFAPCNLGLPVAEIVDRVWWALGAVGIEALAPRDPARLSGGQGQLVALASVLALRPKYLILDEPTSELDPAGTRLIADALVRVAAETGAGILLVEHKLDVLARIADEVVVLDRGLVALSGESGTVLADPRLDGLGVEPPAGVRLERAVGGAGIEWSAEMAAASAAGAAR